MAPDGYKGSAAIDSARRHGDITDSNRISWRTIRTRLRPFALLYGDGLYFNKVNSASHLFERPHGRTPDGSHALPALNNIASPVRAADRVALSARRNHTGSQNAAKLEPLATNHLDDPSMPRPPSSAGKCAAVAGFCTVSIAVTTGSGRDPGKRQYGRRTMRREIVMTLAILFVGTGFAQGLDSYYKLGQIPWSRKGSRTGTWSALTLLRSLSGPHTYWVHVPAIRGVPARQSDDFQRPGVQNRGRQRSKCHRQPDPPPGDSGHVTVFINPGKTPEQPEPSPADWGDRSTNRPTEYNTPDDKYARVICDELLPFLSQEYNISKTRAAHWRGQFGRRRLRRRLGTPRSIPQSHQRCRASSTCAAVTFILSVCGQRQETDPHFFGMAATTTAAQIQRCLRSPARLVPAERSPGRSPHETGL